MEIALANENYGMVMVLLQNGDVITPKQVCFVYYQSFLYMSRYGSLICQQYYHYLWEYAKPRMNCFSHWVNIHCTLEIFYELFYDSQLYIENKLISFLFWKL